MASTERRRNERWAITRPVKLRCIQTGRYVAGRLCNASTHGAMLEVYQPSILVGGQRLQLGIAWKDGQAVLDSDQFVLATVVRSLGMGGVQHVAVQFDEPLSMLAQSVYAKGA